MPDIAATDWSEREDRNMEPAPNGWPIGAMPSPVDQIGRMMMAAIKRWYNKANPVYLTSGTGDDYIVQLEGNTNTINLYEIIRVRIDRSNVGTTPTLKYGDTNVRTIVKFGPSGVIPLAAGDLYAGNDAALWYNGTYYILSNPAIIIGGTVQPYSPNLTSWAAITRATNFDAFVANPTSANLIALVSDETGTGSLVFNTSPTLVTPALGVASATSINKVAITQPATGATITIPDGVTVTGPASSGTLISKTSTDTLTNKTFDTAGSGNSLLINGLAATANTGTGAVVRATSPTMVTPVLGAATGTSLQLSGLTASSAVATDASKNLVSITNTGTGNNVLATSPTLVTPILGVATATSLAITSGASLGTNYSSTYSGNLGLTTASLQSPLTTNAAYYLHGTTTSLNQNFLAQYELISNTVSNTLGGAVALDVYTEATANSGGVWTYAGSVTLDAGFAFGTYSAIGMEQDINNQAGDYSDIAASASIGVSLNGLGYRNSAALYVNNMQQYVVATSTTTAGNAVLTFSGGVPAYFKVGGVITDLTSPSVIPANTTILSTTATTITLSANVTGAGVAIGDHIQVAQPLWYQGIKFAPYGVLQYSINDQSNSATVLNVGGSHSFGIDFTSATIAGAAIRLGVGASQGITARFSGTDYALLSADAAGRGVIGNTTLGTRFNGTVGIGVNPDPTMGLLIGGTITNGAGNALGFDVTPTLVPVTGAAGVFFQSGGAVNTGASNTIAGAYSAYLAAPTKTGTGTITTAYSLFLEAPASGATNYSLYAAGASRFATSAQIDGYLSRTAPVIKTADFTVAATDNWLICNKGSTLTVTLPAVASFVGREIIIKTIQAFTVVSATSNVIPLAGGAAGTAILAATAGKWATLVSDGTSWNIMAGN